jgi:hypothetical protein
VKTLKPDELIELLPATPQQLTDLLAKFELAAPILCREPGYVKHLAAEGWIENSIVAIGGRQAFLIGWHITPDQGFWFDVVITLHTGAPYTACVEAVEQLARQRRCKYIRWVTLRRGIVKWAQDLGYTAEAVILTKKL